MKRRSSILLFTAGFLLAAGFCPLKAQVLQKGAQQLPRALGKQAAVQPAASVWKNFTVPIPAAAKTPAAPPANASFKSRMASKYPGAVVAYEQRIKNLSLQQALRRVVELRGLTPPKGWVKTTDQNITVPHLDGLTLDGYTGDFPSLPIPTNKIYLYRGMGLNEPALRNILQHGLRPQDTGSQANALGTQMRLLHMGTMPVTSNMLKDLEVKQTYLTPNAQETLHYAYLNSFEQGRIPVVVTVRGWRKNDMHHVVREEIPPSDFVEVSALVQGPQGNPIWCRVTLAEDGHSFIITPYLPK